MLYSLLLLGEGSVIQGRYCTDRDDLEPIQYSACGYEVRMFNAWHPGPDVPFDLEVTRLVHQKSRKCVLLPYGISPVQHAIAELALFYE